MSKAKHAWDAYKNLTYEEKLEYLELEKESLEDETEALERIDLQMAIVKAFKPIEDGFGIGKRALARKMIITTLVDTMNRYPDMRFTQILHNLDINQSTGEFQLRDVYNDVDENVADRVTSAYLKMTNNGNDIQ